jgi:hypothetical protein
MCAPEDPVDHVERCVAHARARVDGHEPAGAAAVEHVGRVQIAMQENLRAAAVSERGRVLAPAFKLGHRHHTGGIGVGGPRAGPELEEELDPRRERRELLRGAGFADAVQHGDEH